MASRDTHGVAALHAIDKLLADRPDKVGHDFSEATRCVTAFRDELVEAWRASRSEDNRKRMVLANAVLSVIVGGHYPLGGIPWQHIENARKELVTLV